MNFDKKLFTVLRKDITAALNEVGKKHKVELRAGNASFNPQLRTGNFKLAVTALDDGGKVRDIDAENYTAFAVRFGMRPEDLGRKIRLDDEEYYIAGLNPKARKNPILIKRAKDDKTFVLDAVRATRALSKSEA